MRALETQGERASMHDELDADKMRLYRSTVARLNSRAVDRPGVQYAVRVSSKWMAGPGANDWQRLKRAARYVNGWPYTGIVFAWQTRRGRFTVQTDSD